MGIREEFVEVPGGRLWSATLGRGVPMMLCHGGPGAYDYLQPVAELVEDLAEVHRFDQRGGGRSRAGGPWTVAAMLSDMEVLRRFWRHERWLVGGHSWGAHLALFYALAYPDRVLGLVFLNGTGVRWGWGPERRMNRMQRLSHEERAEVQRLDDELIGGDEHAIDRLRELMWLTDFSDRKIAARCARFDRYTIDPAVLGDLEHDWRLALRDVEPRLSELVVPALVLHGEADPIGQSGPREFARLLPRGRFALLRGGHIPWLEDPRETSAHLRSFIEHLGPSDVP
ncbi:MAG: alpha/beta hydrolase [Actinomycetota bacterium]|nr:alpha/beta hydrolase [Actinomycetota bacterium]